MYKTTILNSFFTLLVSVYALEYWDTKNQDVFYKTIEEIAVDYEDDQNSVIATTENDDEQLYEDFYEEFDNRIITEQSMNMIFFGPAGSFMRLDTETILHIFLYTKHHLIPITRTLLAWDIITDGKTSAFLQGREYLAFSSLLNVVPEEDLYYVNFGDPTVLKYFSNTYIKLDPRKYGVLAAAYRRYFGDTWYTNSSSINRLGYLICGFSPNELKKISPDVFKEINVDIFSKIQKCTVDQLEILYHIATNTEAYGEPYTWKSFEVNHVNTLLTCVPDEDISSLQLEAVAAISYNVMQVMPQRKLVYFTKQQIKRMNTVTRRMYILRMELRNSYDMSKFSKYSACSPSFLTIFFNIVVLFVLYFYFAFFG